jgi:hypothetical protein
MQIPKSSFDNFLLTIMNEVNKDFSTRELCKLFAKSIWSSISKPNPNYYFSFIAKINDMFIMQRF